VALVLPPAVDRADAVADEWLDHVRGNAAADRVFYVASQLGDFSVVWHLVNVGMWAAGVRSKRQVVRFALLLGAESLIVNQGVKRLFRRDRPSFSGDHPHHVRTPSTSSFPSGHASSATFAALVLSTEHPRLRWLFAAIAVTVGGSRPYVRAHHASDVAGGVAVGAVLAFASRPFRRRA
jgi:membrane-associated phospholipid phosphatase